MLTHVIDGSVLVRGRTGSDEEGLAALQAGAPTLGLPSGVGLREVFNQEPGEVRAEFWRGSDQGGYFWGSYWASFDPRTGYWEVTVDDHGF